jgi:hypothetical protein
MTDLGASARKLQYGNEQEAIDGAAEIVDARLQQHKEQAEIAKSQAALKRIADDNPDIINDPFAYRACEQGIYEILDQDLKKLGYTQRQLEEAYGHRPEAHELASLHMKHRAAGHNVRSAEQFMGEAISKYRNWKNGVGGLDGASPNVSKAVAARINQTRGLRGATGLDADYSGAPSAPGVDPETSRRSSIVEGMRASRAAARSVGFRDLVAPAGKRSATA